jgi:hypothetical protein
MPVYPTYKFQNNVPRLLAGFPLQRTFQSNRVNQARHFIGLVKRGIGEYNNRLDNLDKELAQQPGGRTERPYDPASVSYGPAAQGTTTVSGEVIVQGQEAPTGLTESQRQHLFEILARQHRTLNRRGYPHTSDVTDEQEMLFPNTQPATRDEIESSWDDWSDEHSKRMYRHHRSDRDHDDDHDDDWRRRERHSRAHGSDRDHDDDRDDGWRQRERQPTDHGSDRDHDDDRDDEWRRHERHYELGRREREAVFRKLARDRIRLDRHGFPYSDEVREAQRDLFPDSSPLSRGEIDDAWAAWISEGRREEFGRERYSRYRERERDEHRRRIHHHGGHDEEEDDKKKTASSSDTGRSEDTGSGTALSRGQIHHLFEVLNYKRKHLTDDGYPYRSDMREEQTRIYPDTRLVSSDDIEQAWHSWHEPRSKREFRERGEGESERDREEDRDRREGRDRDEDRYRREGRDRDEDRYRREGRDRDEDRDRREGRDRDEDRDRREGRDRDEDRDRHKGRDRDEDRYRREGRDRDEDRGRREGRDRDEGRDRPQDRSESRYRVEPKGRDSPNLFRIFDEHVVNYRLSPEALPHLIIVNEDLRQRGAPEFRTSDELLLEWRRYLLTVARLRAIQGSEQREPTEGGLAGGEASGAPLVEERPDEVPSAREEDSGEGQGPRRRSRRPPE